MLTRYTCARRVTVTICLSVRLSQVGTVPRHNSNRAPPTEAPNRGGVGYFRPISRYISETVQDRDMVTMER